MQLDLIECLNAGVLEPGLNGGHFLVRFPQAVRNGLNNRARFVSMDSAGCEIRFVTPAPDVQVTVSALRTEAAEPCRLRVLRGAFSCQEIAMVSGRTYTLHLTPPVPFNETRGETLNGTGFHSAVWRLVADSRYRLCVHDINTFGHELRPPTTEELPSLTWLAYGSSITHSFIDGYPHVAAQTLKVQVLNKGLSGACHLEPELIDWLVDSCQWNFASLEMGINMRHWYTPEAFAHRVRYALKRFAESGKPVLVTNIYPNGYSIGNVRDASAVQTVSEEAFNAIVREEVQAAQAANLHFVEGSEILDDPTCWSADCLHPTAYGHARMGMNLASIMRRTLWPDLHSN